MMYVCTHVPGISKKKRVRHTPYIYIRAKIYYYYYRENEKIHSGFAHFLRFRTEHSYIIDFADVFDVRDANTPRTREHFGVNV